MGGAGAGGLAGFVAGGAWWWGGSVALSAVALGPERLAGGGLPPEPGVGGDVHEPAFAVAVAVVLCAQRSEVVQVGVPTLVPRFHARKISETAG